MDIIYKLTNINKKHGKRFYIGSKKECQLIDINNSWNFFKLDSTTLNRYFLKYIRDNLILNED